MDTSETYIKMCEKAEEIQVHKISEGDYYYSDNWERGHELVKGRVAFAYDEKNWDGDVSYVYSNSTRVIWLPHQDQLQEMIGNFTEQKDLLNRYFNSESPDYIGWDAHVTSMEQLWLAFVMYERYGKIWDGTNWIKRA